MYTYLSISLSIYVYIYIYIEREREREIGARSPSTRSGAVGGARNGSASPASPYTRVPPPKHRLITIQ